MVLRESRDLHVLVDARSGRRTLHTSLLHGSSVVVRARAITRGHRRDAVSRRAGSAGTDRVDATKGRQYRVCDSAGARCGRYLSRAAANATRTAVAGSVLDARATAEGADDRAAVLESQHRLSSSRRIHADVDAALAAVDQRLQ